MGIKVQAESFDPGTEISSFERVNNDIGAVVSFTGYVRDEAGTLAALEIEHFPEMAQHALETLEAEARAKWPNVQARIIHRFGTLKPGEPIVLVMTSGRHRMETFDAAQFLMDQLKTDAPFWKKQHPKDTREPASWVQAKASDTDAALAWSEAE